MESEEQHVALKMLVGVCFTPFLLGRKLPVSQQ